MPGGDRVGRQPPRPRRGGAAAHRKTGWSAAASTLPPSPELADGPYAVDPSVTELVVDNPGTAIADCYLEPGHRTADVFVTYEDTHAAYTGGGWLGGNVFDPVTGYRSGAELDPSGTAFWHLVHGVPDSDAMRDTLRTAFTRGAGYAYATSTAMPNPWNAAPVWRYRTQTGFAAALGE